MKKMRQSLGMVDVGAKEITERKAIASAQITLSPKAFQHLIRNESPKGDVLEAAKIAGILAAKLTPQMIPHCHPLELTKVKVTFSLNKNLKTVTVQSEVSCLGRTGVEMEALAASSLAALTIYDMMKWADKGMVISDVKLLHKVGGQSGDYHRK